MFKKIIQKAKGVVKSAVTKAKGAVGAVKSAVQAKVQPVAAKVQPKVQATAQKIEQSAPYKVLIGDPKQYSLGNLTNDALTFAAMLPGLGLATKGITKAGIGGATATKVAPKLSGAASKVLPKALPRGVEYIAPARVAEAAAGGARSAAAIPLPAVRQPLALAGRGVMPEAAEAARVGRIALQPNALVPVGERAVARAPIGTRALVPTAETLTGGARAAAGEIGAGAARAGTTQAMEAAQAGAASLGSRIAGAGAKGLQGLKSVGQFAAKHKTPLIGAGLAGGFAYGLWPRGEGFDDEQAGQEQGTEGGFDPPDGMDGQGVGGAGGGGAGGMPNFGEMTNELFAAIDEAASQNSAVTMAWLNQMTETLDKLEADIIEQYRQQGQEIDPATQAALKQIRDQVALKRQNMMEDMNRRGVLQSGLWIEEENRLMNGQLSAEEQLLAGRLSDIQNRMTDTMQSFAQQRMNIMGEAWQNEMQNTQWAGQQRVGALADMQAMQAQAARAGGRSSGRSGGSSSATRKYLDVIPDYPDLQSALQDFNTHRGAMLSDGADIGTILQNIYAYFGG